MQVPPTHEKPQHDANTTEPWEPQAPNNKIKVLLADGLICLEIPDSNTLVERSRCEITLVLWNNPRCKCVRDGGMCVHARASVLHASARIQVSMRVHASACEYQYRGIIISVSLNVFLSVGWW